MARRQITVMGQGRVAISPALVGIAVLGLASGLAQKAADTLCYLMCALTGMALEALPGIVLSLARGLESFALEHGWLFYCLHLVASGVPLLHWLAGAI
jgi:hypothetical protein